ncbi:MAG: hypothetical protein KKA84_11940 [Bacteroidetes bacterium]|nr:hypothetical protein [Bacteroidota bacterium]
MTHIAYEVFIDQGSDKGTMTIAHANSEAELKLEISNLLKGDYELKDLHADKWKYVHAVGVPIGELDLKKLMKD